MKSRVNKISASWFRGFADTQCMELGDKSVVVYGENGSGKSSFVDIVEYLIRGGEIEHLRHEYSGRRQERGVINTHRPKDGETKLVVGFEDASTVEAEITATGSCSISPAANNLSTLESQRVILRQDEVSDFIKGTKGEKYSSLLPLLGLGSLDTAIENLRKIEKEIREQTRLEFKKGEIREVQAEAIAKFGGGELGKQSLVDELSRLHGVYCSPPQPSDAGDASAEVEAALSKKVEAQTKEQATYNDLSVVSRVAVAQRISEIRSAASKLAKSSEPLIAEKLDVLEKASSYAGKLDAEEVQCPACGTTVTTHDLKQHVAKEHSRLESAHEDFKDYKKKIDALCGELQQLKGLLARTSVKDWKEAQDAAKVQYVEELDVSALRSDCTEESLKNVESNVGPLVQSADGATKQAPPDVKELIADKDTITLIRRFIKAKETNTFIGEIDTLISFLQVFQSTLREKIKTQSSSAISAISDDIARMWETLHPEESIEGVNLYLPAEQDKAIEICLKFYGVEQMSPRLTLSEGHRNSLGLCIFLAMAKNIVNKNVPIILDDVVVSFDRNHRGRVAELLEKELGNRQILLFTHDREWFIELRQLLDASRWEFRALIPWRDPATGVRWSNKETTFDDARELLESKPPAAGNEARKIMDTWLPILAEKLKLKMPYLFREKNDHRMAHEFLERIISDGRKCFQIKDGESYRVNSEALSVLEEANKQLAARANRASHSDSLTKIEATDLINKCEAAINVFTCSQCNTLVIRADDSSTECVQCRCGTLMWRYGKV